MMMILILAAVFLVLGAVGGYGLTVFFDRLQDEGRLRAAQEEADRILAESKDQALDLMNEAKERAESAADILWQQNEKELGTLQKRVEEQELNFRKKRSEGDRGYSLEQRELQKQIALISARDRKVGDRQKRYDQVQQKAAELVQSWIEKLEGVSGLDRKAVKLQILQDLETQIQIDAKRKASAYEDEIRAQSEFIAKRILSVALSRFPREACTERGIGLVELPNAEVKAKLFARDGENIKCLEGLAGVDVTVNESNVLQISGFDPVRRELTLRCLERLLNERNLTPQIVEKVFEKTKREVFQKIEADGRKLAHELGMQDLHNEIKNMLGSLRYRYSFAQNQYFHVAEVGWLCGTLATELGSVEPRAARRSGLLHDIGKAMDHSIDGGHAVIGADFIKKWGEQDHIVHAVRAHHYEEQPSTDLAFLVIAADAISGARPGARRSTVNVYNQKIEALSTIGDGFSGVNRTLVFNAGREVRILVDANKVNDQQSLTLCREIANKIEAECTYPGQIKVVVVRESHAQAVAK